MSHAFGHTRFGDPSSGESLQGEREIVIKYENPIRSLNEYTVRLTYYSQERDETIFIENGEIRAGVWRIVRGQWIQISAANLNCGN